MVAHVTTGDAFALGFWECRVTIQILSFYDLIILFSGFWSLVRISRDDESLVELPPELTVNHVYHYPYLGNLEGKRFMQLAFLANYGEEGQFWGTPYYENTKLGLENSLMLPTVRKGIILLRKVN